jgi:hypothetical protein
MFAAAGNAGCDKAGVYSFSVFSVRPARLLRGLIYTVPRLKYG